MASPLLLPLLRSRSQGDILAVIMLEPQRERSLTEIAEDAGTSVSTVVREVVRLEEAGLVATTRRGNTRLVRVVTDSVVYKPLAGLLAVTFGPSAVLRTALAEVPGTERAVIYGSWAARHAQRAGPVPDDIDLLVIGDPDRHVLADAVAEAEPVLRREVNVRRVSAQAWAAGDGSFKQTVLSRPIVDVIGVASVSEARWPVGEAELQNLIDEGELEEVEPSWDHARLLMRQAETHLASAPVLLPAAPPGAFAVLHDAARRSLGAVLAQQGLRTTRKNGQRATQEAIEAQSGPNAKGVVRPFRALRIRRHDAKCLALDTPEVTAEEAEEALDDARAIVEAMREFLPHVGPWQG